MIGAAHENMGMDRRLTPEVLAANAQWAVRVWPELERKRILRFWTGLRVWPKDAYPIYDRIPGHENAFVFAMHSAVSLAAILEQALPTMSWASRCRRTGPSSGCPGSPEAARDFRDRRPRRPMPRLRTSDRLQPFFKEYGYVRFTSRGGGRPLWSMLRLRASPAPCPPGKPWRRRFLGTRTPGIRASIL